MRIHLRQLDGQVSSIEVDPTATFGSLKVAIAHAARLSSEGVALVFDGAAQADDIRLIDACVTEQTALTVVIGGGSVFVDDLGAALAPPLSRSGAAHDESIERNSHGPFYSAEDPVGSLKRGAMELPLASLTNALVNSLSQPRMTSGSASAPAAASWARALSTLRDDDLLPLDAVTAMDAVPRLHLLLPSGTAVAVDLSSGSGGGGDSGSDTGSVSGGGRRGSDDVDGDRPRMRLRDMHPIRHLRASAAAAACLPISRTGLVLRGRRVPRSLDASAAIGQLGLSPAGDTVIHVVYEPRKPKSRMYAPGQASTSAAAVAAAAAAGTGASVSEVEAAAAASDDGEHADEDEVEEDEEDADDTAAAGAHGPGAAAPGSMSISLAIASAAARVFDGETALGSGSRSGSSHTETAAAAVDALVAASSASAAAAGAAASSSPLHAHSPALVHVPDSVAALLSDSDSGSDGKGGSVYGTPGRSSSDSGSGSVSSGPVHASGTVSTTGRLHAHCPCCAVAGAHFAVAPLCPVCLCRAAGSEGGARKDSQPLAAAASAASSTVLLSGALPPADAHSYAAATAVEPYFWKQLLDVRVACVRCGYAGPPELGFACRAVTVTVATGVAGSGTGTGTGIDAEAQTVFPSDLDVPAVVMRAVLSRQAAPAFAAGLLPGGASAFAYTSQGAAGPAVASAAASAPALRPCPSGPVTLSALLPLLRAAQSSAADRSAARSAVLSLPLPLTDHTAGGEASGSSLDPRVAQSLLLCSPGSAAGAEDDPLPAPLLALPGGGASLHLGTPATWSSALGPAFATAVAAANAHADSRGHAAELYSASAPLALSMDPTARAARLLAQVHALLSLPAGGGFADTIDSLRATIAAGL